MKHRTLGGIVHIRCYIDYVSVGAGHVSLAVSYIQGGLKKVSHY